MSAPDTNSIPWLKIVMAIVILVILMIVIVIMYRYQKNLRQTEPDLLIKPTPSFNVPTINNASQSAALSVTGQEYTYNFWMYVDNWGKNYGKLKHVFTRASASPFSSSPAAGIANPTIWLYPDENNLAIRVSTLKISDGARATYDKHLYPEYDHEDTHNGGRYTNVNPHYYYRKYSSSDPKKAYEYVNTTVACDIANIPLQRWVMVTVVMWNRTLDVYINGMLTRSVVLPGAPLFDPSHLSNIYVGGSQNNQTFGGYFSKIKYYNKAITAHDVMKLYEKGPLTSNYWWNALKYNIKLTLDIDQDN